MKKRSIDVDPIQESVLNDILLRSGGKCTKIILCAPQDLI
jgi:hypothetical protein